MKNSFFENKNRFLCLKKIYIYVWELNFGKHFYSQKFKKIYFVELIKKNRINKTIKNYFFN